MVNSLIQIKKWTDGYKGNNTLVFYRALLDKFLDQQISRTRKIFARIFFLKKKQFHAIQT